MGWGFKSGLDKYDGKRDISMDKIASVSMSLSGGVAVYEALIKVWSRIIRIITYVVYLIE